MSLADHEQNKKVKAFLDAMNLAVVSTSGSDGEIYAASVYFIVDKEFHFYFRTKRGTKKYESLKTEPRVAVTASDAETFRTVQARGSARVIDDVDLASGVMNDIVQSYTQRGVTLPAPIAQIDAGAYAVVQVRPDWLRFGDFQNPNAKEHFVQVIPEENMSTQS